MFGIPYRMQSAHAISPGREEEVRSELQAILSSGEFSPRPQGPGLLERIGRMIKGLVDWIYDKITGMNLPRNPLSTKGVRLSPEALLLMKIAGIIILAVFVAVIVLFLVRNLKFSKRLRRMGDETLLTSLREPDTVLDMALGCAGRGDFKQGIRYLFIALLLELNRANYIKIEKSKTNSQYLRELAENGFGMRHDMREFSQDFNRFWYGNAEPEKSKFDFWYGKYFEFLKAVAA